VWVRQAGMQVIDGWGGQGLPLCQRACYSTCGGQPRDRDQASWHGRCVMVGWSGVVAVVVAAVGDPASWRGRRVVVGVVAVVVAAVGDPASWHGRRVMVRVVAVVVAAGGDPVSWS
jgi:hypothetical protein